MASHISQRTLIGLAIALALVVLVGTWMFPVFRPGTPTDESSTPGADAASTTTSASRSPARASGGKLDAARTPWRLEQPRPDARVSPADHSRRPLGVDAACARAIGRWQIPPRIDLVLERSGRVSRVQGNLTEFDSSSSWTCTPAGDVVVQLPEGRFTGNLNNTAEYALTGPNGTRLEHLGGFGTEGN